MSAASRPGPLGHRAPVLAEPGPALLERHPARAGAPGPGPCRGRRARCPAAAAGRKRAPGQARGQHRRRRGGEPGRPRPARGGRQHDDAARPPAPAPDQQRAGARPAPRRAKAGPAGCAGPAAARVADEGAGDGRRVAGPQRQRDRGVAGERACARGASSTSDVAPVERPPGAAGGRGPAAPRGRRRSAGSRRPAPRRPRRWWPGAARARARPGSPSPELGVDRVGADDPLGQLGPGVGALVGEPGAADDGDRLGAVRPRTASSRAAASASASDQPTWRCRSPLATIGSVTRPTWLAVSATSPANWPCGRPEPRVTGSASSPGGPAPPRRR